MFMRIIVLAYWRYVRKIEADMASADISRRGDETGRRAREVTTAAGNTNKGYCLILAFFVRHRIRNGRRVRLYWSNDRFTARSWRSAGRQP